MQGKHASKGDERRRQ